MISKIACFIIMMLQYSLSITVQSTEDTVQSPDTAQPPVRIDFDDYVKAWLQSSGIVPEDRNYMSSFYERLYGEDVLCGCNGCFIYDTCLRCVSFKNCENINGTFCRD